MILHGIRMNYNEWMFVVEYMTENRLPSIKKEELIEVLQTYKESKDVIENIND